MRNLKCFKFLTFSGYVSQNSRTATEKKMLKRKTFLKKKASRDISASRNLRLRRLKHRKAKQFQRHALQLVIQDI